jgi:DNA polymerase elongation subunit (family B)
MPGQWLLDITDARDGRSVVLWTKTAEGRIGRAEVPFRPPFWVGGRAADLVELKRELKAIPGVDIVRWRTARVSLFDHHPKRHLLITPERNFQRRRVATAIDAFGEYRKFALYDVDLSIPQLYHLEHGLYPFAPVEGAGATLRATEPAETIDYAAPPIAIAPLSVTVAGKARGRPVPPEGPITSVQLDRVTLEGTEEGILRELVQELARSEPDLLLTDGGDAFDLPWLYRRAEAIGLHDQSFYLGREPVSFRAARPARSFESYGRVEYRSATFPLPGRFHVDRENSFLFDDTSVDGLIDAARLARLSLQTVVRQSPGTCFTAMEMAHARAQGVHVPWKKNRPEEFKSGVQLVAADRGGVIFLPPVGVHDHVDEFDFASLYPHIMVRKNLSTETLDCPCCPTSPIVAPGLGYHSCVRRVGLIPRTLQPLLERRLAYKATAKRPGTPPAERKRLLYRVKMLKWILVTAFGYQGYRNARFGRIECHEAINAYARELLGNLVPAAEAAGYRVVHGIVDSLWLRPDPTIAPPDPERFAQRMSARYDLPLGYEGRYRWIVFLPAVTHGFGVPNRYFGRYENGEFKLRGIGARRHDTTGCAKRLEGEILELFGHSRDAAGVRAAVPRALARADLFAHELRAGRWPIEELVITHRIGKPPGEFVTFTDSVAALRQLAQAGIERHAGEYVRYVILDRRSRSWRERVRAEELLEGNERYDAEAYLELLARNVETLLAPFGVDRELLARRWRTAPAPERERYRSPERRDQQILSPVAAGAPGTF